MFDFHLLKMKESGVVDKILTRYYPDPPQTFGVTDANPLGYDNLIFPALVLSFGMCGALGVVLMEKLMRQARKTWMDADAIAPNISQTF